MAVDLDRCNGCAACVVACHAENNISTVGADEAARGRAKHWLRIERYWEGEFPDARLTFRPVLCQHCANAPCEPVCPTQSVSQGDSIYAVNQETCVECVGHHDSPQCLVCGP